MLATVKFTAEESEYGLKFILVLLGCSFALFVFLFKLLNDLDSTSGDQSYLLQASENNAIKDYTTCIICKKKGSESRTLYVGGCEDYCHCQECFRTYQPLPSRCMYCHALLCYRKYRTIVVKNTKKDN